MGDLQNCAPGSLSSCRVDKQALPAQVCTDDVMELLSDLDSSMVDSVAISTYNDTMQTPGREPAALKMKSTHVNSGDNMVSMARSDHAIR